MIRPILDWFRGRKGDGAALLEASTHGNATTAASPSTEFETQVLVQGGLVDLKRVTQILEQQSIDSQIVVPPSGCNT